jgi:hypothetical protein
MKRQVGLIMAPKTRAHDTKNDVDISLLVPGSNVSRTMISIRAEIPGTVAYVVFAFYGHNRDHPGVALSSCIAALHYPTNTDHPGVALSSCIAALYYPTNTVHFASRSHQS